VLSRLRFAWAVRHQLLAQSRGLPNLPPAVRRFYIRAWLRAIARRDSTMFVAPASVAQLRLLIKLANEAQTIVELGTGGATTALALVIGLPGVRLISYDPTAWPAREHYLELASTQVRDRLELRTAPGELGPKPGDPPVDFLFIDSSHEEQETVASFGAWRGSLAPRAVVAFHDYDNPEFPGVAQAVARLGLAGEEQLGMFVARVGAG
jgi:predicted O-methyltransferase YrrM